MNRHLIFLISAATALAACGGGNGNGGSEPQTAAPAAEAQPAASATAAAIPDPRDRTGNYEDLLALHEEFRAWIPFSPVDGVTDYSDDAIATRIEEIDAMQERLRAIGVQGWSVPQQVDWLTTRAQLTQQEFILRVTRPWNRDPTFYLSALLEIAFTDLPLEGEQLATLRERVREIPPLLEQARANLDDVADDNAALAIRSLTQSDGVEHGYPYRADPPAGIIAWYEDLRSRAGDSPELETEIGDALQALNGFRDWLVENRERMDGENGVGKAALDWYVHNGLLLPWTSDELLVLGQREFERLWAFYALERHRNRGLPEIELPESGEEYRERLASTDELIRTWLVEDDVITIPDFIPEDWEEMGYNVPWRVRDTGPNFWEAVQFRDPSPDHLHAVIPGHRFDGWVARNLENPIRRHANFGVRREGWAVYLEEGMMQAGVLEERPRARELIYVFGIWRASRTVGDILNQQNVMSAAQTADWWVEVTPMLDPDVARKYAHVRPLPGHGLQYTIGAVQIFDLLGARKRELREEFVLEEFHDEIMTMGRIPVVLIRWQMTGDDAVVEPFWQEQPLEAFLADQRG